MMDWNMNNSQTVPVAYKGRFIPVDVYAKSILHEFYGKDKIKTSHFSDFNLPDNTALTFLLKYYFVGSKPFDDAPLFQISHAEIKKSLDLNLKEDHFSYNQLQKAVSNIGTPNFLKIQEKRHESIANTLVLKLADHKNWKGSINSNEVFLSETPLVTPLVNQLQNAGDLFKIIPTKKNGVFVSLHTLKMKVKDKTGTLKFIDNFTPYKNEDFQAIREAYFALEKAYINQDTQAILPSFDGLMQALSKPYAETLAGTPAIEAFQKTYIYPTTIQLKSESIYTRYPLIEGTIVLYALALIGFLLAKTLKSGLLKKSSFVLFLLSFLLHSFILGLRCFILDRPPVSNMFETVIYVPWIAILAGISFYTYTKNSLLLIASSVSALVLLVILEVTNLSRQLEQPQAVLDSQYWLTVHVMLIVGSYGVFFLSAILGHIYLGYSFFNKLNVKMKSLEFSVLQTLYLGCFMLIPGTILGGVWAAESWGRFWDWDPKESWAFISCCVYLVVIHAYRFNKIKAFGLCMGAIIGFLAISFTWYGVNYILGTGLHSYGFGNGGERFYYFFLLAELIFLLVVSYKNKIVDLRKKVEM